MNIFIIFHQHNILFKSHCNAVITNIFVIRYIYKNVIKEITLEIGAYLLNYIYQCYEMYYDCH